MVPSAITASSQELWQRDMTKQRLCILISCEQKPERSHRYVTAVRLWLEIAAGCRSRDWFQCSPTSQWKKMCMGLMLLPYVQQRYI